MALLQPTSVLLALADWHQAGLFGRQAHSRAASLALDGNGTAVGVVEGPPTCGSWLAWDEWGTATVPCKQHGPVSCGHVFFKLIFLWDDITPATKLQFVNGIVTPATKDVDIAYGIMYKPEL